MDEKLMAKPGLDGHDRGAWVVSLGLRDAGMEVVYTGLHQTPEMIVQAAIQEGVNFIGLSCLSGAHKFLFPRVMELLKENDFSDIAVIGGGAIPKEDIPYLLDKGIKAVFTPGTTISQIVDYIKENKPEFKAVTGLTMTEEDILKAVGSKGWNLERMIMVREGRRRENDWFNESVFTRNKAWLNKEQFRAAMNEYYQARGWDLETEMPKKETLEELKLEYLAEELENKYGIASPP